MALLFYTFFMCKYFFKSRPDNKLEINIVLWKPAKIQGKNLVYYFSSLPTVCNSDDG